MLSPEKILAVVRELEPRLPALLGEKATEVQHQISPLVDQLAAGRSDGADLLEVLRVYPTLAEELQQRLDPEQSIIEFSLGDSLRDRSYQGLPGTPNTVIAGKKYICPVPECTQEWFRVGLRSPRLCEEHGVVMVPADEG